MCHNEEGDIRDDYDQPTDEPEPEPEERWGWDSVDD
jgi:hypothetical protein